MKYLKVKNQKCVCILSGQLFPMQQNLIIVDTLKYNSSSSMGTDMDLYPILA